ncbi:MED6 mediator subfamily complex component-domain-containing protein [Dipodascopsis uninucleata]
MSDQQPPALDELQWRAPEWIQMFGLRTDNVLEYFAQSPFYDRSSNNQVLKMQSQFNGPMMQQQDISQALSTMRGVEFVIAMSNPASALWIIRKQNRLSSTEVIPLSTYFVINENIYMAPSVYSIVSSRMLSTIKSLRSALVLAADNLPKFSSTMGYSYNLMAIEDDEQASERLQEQMMARALASATQINNEEIFLDVAQTERVRSQTPVLNISGAQSSNADTDRSAIGAQRKRKPKDR